MNQPRLNKLIRLLPAHNLDCAAIIPGPTLYYLTNLSFHLMERPIVAFFTPDAPPTLVAPEFECAKIESPGAWQLFPWRDEEGVEGAFEACCRALKLSGRRVGVEELSMRVKEYTLLATFAPGATVSAADPLIAAMRMLKEADEVRRMKAAVALAEGVLRDTLPAIQIGMTEKEVAAKLMVGLLTAGSEPVPFAPLVQTGPTGAAPHAAAGGRTLEAGHLLIIDFGARVEGYVSDITRTVAVGQIDDAARQIYRAVQDANRAGRAAAAPGAACQDVDRAARRVIEQAGFGQYFTHRTGHGLGLQGHEPPFIVDGNNEVLQPDMTFTVEPGIYIPGLGGVRIEDDVLVTGAGAESLTTFNRRLISVG
ncbi:MAG: M24 family metallopeptidase [Anaerolineae bacterium]